MNIRFGFLFLVSFLFGIGIPVSQGLAEPARRIWTVDGVEREALIYLPKESTPDPVPLIFAFHGHGGNMRHASRVFPFHTLWPQAATVWMQGLKTPGRLTDPDGKKPGWQSRPGDQGDRDLKFFDAVLTTLKKERSVDPGRIFAMGHSNGGSFVYLLWAERGKEFAAFAPSGSSATPAILAGFKPKPVLHVAGKQDPLVRFAWQERTMTDLRRLNGAGTAVTQSGPLTQFQSPGHPPVWTWVHDGGHTFPPAVLPEMVRFFKESAPNNPETKSEK